MKAKLIATFGPSIKDKSTVAEIKSIGVSNFRFNTAHMEPEDIPEYIEILTDGFGNRDEYTVMLDLKGPELRTNDFEDGSFKFSDGGEYWIGEGSEVWFNNSNIYSKLKTGTLIILNDGKVKLQIKEIRDGKILVSAVQGGIIRSRSRVNIPGVKLDLGSLTERDLRFIRAGIRASVDFFALSFTQDQNDVIKLRKAINESGGRQLIISKIETLSGVMNSYQIARTSDFVMIARGDLGVELPINEVAVTQKMITRDVKKAGKQAILATQILESMVLGEEPTRAEISDITNAVYDGVDSFLLTDETAIGKHPVEALKYLAQTVDYSEKSSEFKIEVENVDSNPISFSMAKSAKIISDILNVDIIAFTKNGNTVRILSALRPNNKILGVTHDTNLYRKMLLYHNVTPIFVEFNENYGVSEYLNLIAERENIGIGKKFVVVSGEDYFTFGGTNDVKIHLVGKFIGRGNYSGKTICGEFGSEIALYSRDLDMNKTRLVIFEESPPFDILDSLHQMGIMTCTLFNFKEIPQEGKKVCIDGESGILYYQ